MTKNMLFSGLYLSETAWQMPSRRPNDEIWRTSARNWPESCHCEHFQGSPVTKSRWKLSLWSEKNNISDQCILPVPALAAPTGPYRNAADKFAMRIFSRYPKKNPFRRLFSDYRENSYLFFGLGKRGLCKSGVGEKSNVAILVVDSKVPAGCHSHEHFWIILSGSGYIWVLFRQYSCLLIRKLYNFLDFRLFCSWLRYPRSNSLHTTNTSGFAQSAFTTSNKDPVNDSSAITVKWPFVAMNCRNTEFHYHGVVTLRSKTSSHYHILRYFMPEFGDLSVWFTWNPV